MTKITLDMNNYEAQVFNYNGRTYEACIGRGWGHYVYFTLIDKTDAYRRGKECKMLSFHALKENVGFTEFHREISNYCEILENYKHEESPRHIKEEDYEIYFELKRAIKVMPVDFTHVTPLKALPRKWTKTSVIKLLANNQFKNFKMDYKFTDDYAWDNAVSFCRDREVLGEEMLKDLIEYGGGCSFSQEENKLKFYFGYKCMTLEIAL